MSELDVTGVANLLGVSRPRVWQLRKQTGFPAPNVDDKGRESWPETRILRWAAGVGRLADRAPLLFRPLATAMPARYFGVEAVSHGTVLTWDTALGRVCMHFYSMTSSFGGNGPDPASLAADVVVSVKEVTNARGPELVAVDAAFPERTYQPHWTDLARVLGTPAPWWPLHLRRPADMQLWRPGARPTVIPPIPDTDVTALLQLASAVPDDTSVHATLTWLARHVQARADRNTQHDLDMAEQWADRDAIAIAGVPTPATEETDEPSETVRRDAWLTILGRSDSLAAACVRTVVDWNGGDDFPFGAIIDFRPGEYGELAEEFLAQLEPCERTAAFARFSARTVDRTFTDPLTGAPAARDETGTWHVAVPRRLPATAPLAEVTFDYGYRVWIRTADANLWIAPDSRGAGTSFGYDGTGPAILAVLLDRLLDDINAAAPHSLIGVEPNPGILAGTIGGWRPGTTVTRAELEAARSRH